MIVTCGLSTRIIIYQAMRWVAPSSEPVYVSFSPRGLLPELSCSEKTDNMVLIHSAFWLDLGHIGLIEVRGIWTSSVSPCTYGRTQC